MAGDWVMTLATLVASAMGLHLVEPQRPSDARPDDEWAFEPLRCDTTREVEVPERPRWIRHRVRSRETISEVAFRYGVEPWEVRGWNDQGRGVERVRRGTRLKVKAARVPPPLEDVEVTVGEGDSWASIARAHGATPMDLRAYNYPYRGKMTPGSTLTVRSEPIVADWVAADPGDEPVARGGVGVGSPDAGTLVAAVPIPEGEGYRLRFRGTAYGTTHAVTELLAALASFRRESGWDGTLAIGAMSGPRGGPLGHHRSHQTGRDVDIRLPRRDGVSRYADLVPRRVDWAAAWTFVVAMSKRDTQVIFFDYRRQKYLHRAAKSAGADEATLKRLLQYPRGRSARRGLVRHFAGHEKHFHVRFGCGPCEVSCASASLAESQSP